MPSASPVFTTSRAPSGTELGHVLLLASAVVLIAAGIACLLVPGSALGIVGVDSTPTAEFLLRTEGVALLFGGALLVATRSAPAQGGQLAALTGYFILSSVVDVAAFTQGIVGPASIPSAVIRVAAGLLCAVLSVRSVRSRV